MVLPLGDLERTRITPYVTYALIAINVMMFLLQESRGDHLMALACTPWEITHNDDIEVPVVAKPPSVVQVRDPRDPLPFEHRKHLVEVLALSHGFGPLTRSRRPDRACLESSSASLRGARRPKGDEESRVDTEPPADDALAVPVRHRTPLTQRGWA